MDEDAVTQELNDAAPSMPHLSERGPEFQGHERTDWYCCKKAA